MGKLTAAERTQVKSLVAELCIKRIPESLIINEIFKKTGKNISRVSLFRIKQTIKRESFKWYKTMREGEYEYLHEFKERINEIMDLQRKAHQVVDDNKDNPSVQLDAISELHKLNITLSNYFDVAPTIVTNPVKQNDTISIPQQETEIIV